LNHTPSDASQVLAKRKPFDLPSERPEILQSRIDRILTPNGGKSALAASVTAKDASSRQANLQEVRQTDAFSGFAGPQAVKETTARAPSHR
jgi:hypothetical protein